MKKIGLLLGLGFRNSSGSGFKHLDARFVPACMDSRFMLRACLIQGLGLGIGILLVQDLGLLGFRALELLMCGFQVVKKGCAFSQ